MCHAGYIFPESPAPRDEVMKVIDKSWAFLRSTLDIVSYTHANLLFELPSSWCWTRLQNPADVPVAQFCVAGFQAFVSFQNKPALETAHRVLDQPCMMPSTC